MLMGMRTLPLICLAALSCAYGAGGTSQASQVLARDWGCVPVRVDSIRNANRNAKAVPTPELGEPACDFFARLNWWGRYTLVGNDRTVSVPKYGGRGWLLLRRDAEGYWRIADRVW